MCSADIFLGLLALLFPPLPGTFLPASDDLASANNENHSLGEARHLLRRFHDQHPPLPPRLRTSSILPITQLPRHTNTPSQIPGLIHAWYIIAKFPEPDYEYESLPQQDREGGRVTYVFVHGNGNGNAPHTRQPQQQPRPSHHQQGANVTYGTTSNNAGGSRQQPQGGAGEGSSDGAVPPSYAQAVAGDNKIQTRD